LDAPVVVRELALMEQAGAVKEAQVGFSRAVLTMAGIKNGMVGLGRDLDEAGRYDVG
jgi:hypothetical protein